jgi:hypothetical protein
VLGHHLVAGLADAVAVLLQTLQDDSIAVIDDRTAKARDIAGAGIVPRLLRNGAGRKESERDNEQRIFHVTPLKRAMNLTRAF